MFRLFTLALLTTASIAVPTPSDGDESIGSTPATEFALAYSSSEEEASQETYFEFDYHHHEPTYEEKLANAIKESLIKSHSSSFLLPFEKESDELSIPEKVIQESIDLEITRLENFPLILNEGNMIEAQRRSSQKTRKINGS
jgi:uncharacterized protein involved in exopolysaccharide biosynthesis